MKRFKFLFSAIALAALTACSAPVTLDGPPADMGDFLLRHNIVVADNAQMHPISRPATADEWEAVLASEIDARLGGYSGDRMLHLGTAVVGYALAPPGIPLVASPKSVLVIHVNVWDNATQEKLTEEPREFIVWEGYIEGAFLLGSGLTQSREEQMLRLSRNAAFKIQEWLLEHPEWLYLDYTPPEEEQ